MFSCTEIRTYVHTHICTKRGPESLCKRGKNKPVGSLFWLPGALQVLLGSICTGPPFFVCFQQKMMMSWNCPSNCPSEQSPREAQRRAESLRAQRRHRDAQRGQQQCQRLSSDCLRPEGFSLLIEVLTRRRLSSSLSSQVSICKLMKFHALDGHDSLRDQSHC